MADLSSVSGVPIATIKFYLREGILPLGDLTRPNQAVYGAAHVERLRLTRALTTTGGLSVAAVKRVLTAIDSDDPLAEVFEVAQQTVSVEHDGAEIRDEAWERVDALTRGWRVSPGNPGRVEAARILETLASLRIPLSDAWTSDYADAALAAAKADLDEIELRTDRDSRAETVVVGTVLGDALFAALRRAAQEHETSGRFAPRAGDDE